MAGNVPKGGDPIAIHSVRYVRERTDRAGLFGPLLPGPRRTLSSPQATRVGLGRSDRARL